MADDDGGDAPDDAEDAADEEPAIELGEGADVEGAPVARVASRLSWPITHSDLLDREGDAEIRTPDGPRTVADVLDEVDTTYFDSRRTFVEAVRAEIGEGPIPTE